MPGESAFMLITEVELTSADPGRAAQRYADVLEVTPTVVADRVELVVGSSRLVVVAGETGPGVHHLAFTVPGRWFDAAVDRLSARVGLLTAQGRTRFDGPPHWNSLSVYFPGPEGAVLEFIQRRDLADEPLIEQASPGSAIAGISEVGVAVRDVAELRRHLADDFGLEPFGTPLADFAPTGDQHGLLICVGPDRPWAPEGVQQSHGGRLRVTMTTPRGRGELTVDADLEYQLAVRAA